MNLIKPHDYIILGIYTVVLLWDYMTSGDFGEFLIFVLAGVAIFALNYKKYKGVSNKEIMNWQLFSTGWIVVLVGLLAIIFGYDQAAIFFNHGLLIFIILLTLFEVFLSSRRLKNNEDPAR
ncbi:hypothetical protein ACFFJI_01735 [Allobacillus sp. GCM10007491]|uniref:Uncharacterized protein n=1 Tax=Allobacillus saliphilus TaxID=2912308 RepID=A0A941CZE4_9BACI|nr:hypothetical protein [Allobacillus saliphilus]MBR7554880.1 hypothetical protein [Allobacillus saliphilus]